MAACKCVQTTASGLINVHTTGLSQMLVKAMFLIVAQ